MVTKDRIVIVEGCGYRLKWWPQRIEFGKRAHHIQH